LFMPSGSHAYYFRLTALFPVTLSEALTYSYFKVVLLFNVQ